MIFFLIFQLMGPVRISFDCLRVYNRFQQIYGTLINMATFMDDVLFYCCRLIRQQTYLNGGPTELH